MALLVVPSFEIHRENFFSPEPAGTANSMVSSSTVTAALLDTGVMVFSEFSHTMRMMFAAPVGPNRSPVTVNVPPAVGTVLAM